MENEKSIFNLTVEGLAKNHLSETWKWGRFLAIAGFISIAGMLVVCTVVLINPVVDDPSVNTVSTSENTIVGIVTMLLFGVLYFFPCYFLLKFSIQMKTALSADDAGVLTEAFKNLKVTFRYIGVVTLIGMVFLLLGLLIGISENGL